MESMDNFDDLFSITLTERDDYEDEDENRKIPVVHRRHSIRSSFSDSDLIISFALEDSNATATPRTVHDLEVIEHNSTNPNMFRPISHDLTEPQSITKDDKNDISNNFRSSKRSNSSNKSSMSNSTKQISINNINSSTTKSSKRKSLFMKHKWIQNPMAFITNCCMTRTDSLIDLQQSLSMSSITNGQQQKQEQEICSPVDHVHQMMLNNDQDEIVGQRTRMELNDNIPNDSNETGDIDDDLLFMDNFPPVNQPLSRIVSLRRRHPNTPMSRSPEPPPLPPHPYPIGIPPGFPDSFIHHLNHVSIFSSDSNSAVSGTASTTDSTYQPTSGDGQPHIYEPYPIQTPHLMDSLRVVTNRSNTTSRSTPTFHTQIDYINRLVPDLLAITNCSFYWGKMDRYEAERLLDGKPEGTFLLRDSAQEDHLFSVSFRRFERSLHARIEHWEHRFSFDSHDPGVFSSPTVTGLIEHYKDPSHCMFFEPILTKPLNRTFTFSLQHLARVTICDHVSYDSINRLPLPSMLKSYLKEYHYRIKVRTRHFDESSLYRWMEPHHHQGRVYFHH